MIAVYSVYSIIYVLSIIDILHVKLIYISSIKHILFSISLKIRSFRVSFAAGYILSIKGSHFGD